MSTKDSPYKHTILCSAEFEKSFNEACKEYIIKIIVPNKPHKCNGTKPLYNINPKQI